MTRYELYSDDPVATLAYLVQEERDRLGECSATYPVIMDRKQDNEKYRKRV